MEKQMNKGIYMGANINSLGQFLVERCAIILQKVRVEIPLGHSHTNLMDFIQGGIL